MSFLTRLLLCLCATGSFLRAANDPSATYYSTAPAVIGGPTLKAALHQIIDGHIQLSYANVWNALEVLDADPSNAANVLLIYNGASRAKSLRDTGNEDDNYWNREHLWPLSLGAGPGGDTSTVAARDLHHLFAADKNVNARRGNLPFDNVTGGSTDPEAPLSRYTGTAYMPRDADKGLIARALFYMAVRYAANDDASSVGDLELQESLSVATPNMARLSTLLAWHRAFPPTETERLRNHRVATLYQGNRNPFIDNPLFADRVFSGDTPFGAWQRPHFSAAELGDAMVSGDGADPDGDGLPNRLEFAFNLAPRTADPAGDARPALTLLPPTTSGGASRLSLAHRRHRYATDLAIRYETSGDLATWTEFTPTATSIAYLDALTDRVTIETPLGETRRFLRVRVERTMP